MRRRLLYYGIVALVWGLLWFGVRENRARVQLELQYRRAFMGASDGIIICRIDDQGQTVITLVNAMAEQITGYSEAELLGEHGLNLLMPDEGALRQHNAGATKAAERLRKSEQGWSRAANLVYAIRVKGSDNPVVCATSTSGVIDSTGQAQFVMLFHPLDKTYTDQEGRAFRVRPD